MTLADIGWLLFSVGGVLIVLLALCAWLVMRPASRAARRWLVATALGYTIVSLYPVAHAGTHLLSRGFEPLARDHVPPGRTAVVVLGSSGYTVFDWANNRLAVLDPIGLSRTLEAARVYRLLDPVWVICSGGRRDPRSPEAPLGETIKDRLVQLGVPESRIIAKDEAADTHDEAVMTARLLPSLHVDRVVLVTSELHIRRAAGAFRAAGVDVIPAPARDAGPRELDWRTRLLPSTAGLQEAAAVVHEIAGLAYYKVKGWR